MVEFKVLDLFCGAGGFSRGIDKNPNFKTLIANDYDPAAALTFSKNFRQAFMISGDITEENIQNKIIENSLKSGINMIVGGPPCQGFSSKGKKLGLNDPRNYLFREFLKVVEEIKPEVFVIENVRGIITSSDGWFLKEILESIKYLGYKASFGVLNAKDYGVPQSRERAFFVCSKSNSINLPPKYSKSVSVRDAISDLSYLNSGEGSFEQEYINSPQSEYQRYMRERSPLLFNHKASNHSELAIHKLSLIPAEMGKEYLPKELLGKQKFRTTWGRLKWDQPSPTIDTRFDTPSNGRNSHPVLNRSITAREAARIQSFDDNFIFYGNKVNIRNQIGNAVPPLLAEAVANKIWEYYK